MAIEFITHPTDSYRLGDFLVEAFADPQWTNFRAAVAFIKRSGTKHIYNGLSSFVDRGGKVKITAGIDVGGTTIEALEDLLKALKDKGDVYVFHNTGSSTFHPKAYLFRNEKHARVAIGSANLTEGGLFTNYEAWCYLTLDTGVTKDAELLRNIEKTLDDWSGEQDGVCFKVTPDLLKKLVAENQLPDEATARAQKKTGAAEDQAPKRLSIFKRRSVPAAPKVKLPEPELPPPSDYDDAVLADSEEAETLVVEEPPPTAAQLGKHKFFLMTLQKTDVGVGQTTKGTQRRSPEIFIPLICRDFDPEFWGWPDLFVADKNWTGPTDQNGRGKMDRVNVMMRLAGETFPVSIWYNPDKRDVRIRSEHIRKAGVVGDILYLERADGTSGFSYYAEIIPQGSVRYDEYIQLCTRAVRNSKKLWNYL